MLAIELAVVRLSASTWSSMIARAAGVNMMAKNCMNQIIVKERPMLVTHGVGPERSAVQRVIKMQSGNDFLF